MSIVIFDPAAPINTGRAVYMSGTAAEDESGIEVFSRRSVARGGDAWTLDDIRPPAGLRLYRATASEQFVFTPEDRRVPLKLG